MCLLRGLSRAELGCREGRGEGADKYYKLDTVDLSPIVIVRRRRLTVRAGPHAAELRAPRRAAWVGDKRRNAAENV